MDRFQPFRAQQIHHSFRTSAYVANVNSHETGKVRWKVDPPQDMVDFMGNSASLLELMDSVAAP